MILGSSTSLGSSVPSATHPPSLTTATTATTGKTSVSSASNGYLVLTICSAYTPNSPTVSSEYSLSNNRLVCANKIYSVSTAHYDIPSCHLHVLASYLLALAIPTDLLLSLTLLCISLLFSRSRNQHPLPSPVHLHGSSAFRSADHFSFSHLGDCLTSQSSTLVQRAGSRNPSMRVGKTNTTRKPIRPTRPFVGQSPRNPPRNPNASRYS